MILESLFSNIIQIKVYIVPESAIYKIHIKTLVEIFYCFHSDSFLKVKVEDKFFDWNAFYVVHNKMSTEELLEIISVDDYEGN